MKLSNFYNITFLAVPYPFPFIDSIPLVTDSLMAAFPCITRLLEDQFLVPGQNRHTSTLETVSARRTSGR